MADVDSKCVYHGKNQNVSSELWQGNTRMVFKTFNVWGLVTEVSAFMREKPGQIFKTKKVCHNNMPTVFHRVTSLGKEIIINLNYDLILLLLLHEVFFFNRKGNWHWGVLCLRKTTPREKMRKLERFREEERGIIYHISCITTIALLRFCPIPDCLFL